MKRAGAVLLAVAGAALVAFVVFRWGGEQPSGRFLFVGADASNVSRLHFVRADGKGLREFTRSGSGRPEADPAWSPDGGRIAFARWFACTGSFGACYGLWIVRADGSDERRIYPKSDEEALRRPYDALSPSWSPDGRRIAFVQTFEDPDESDIYAISADGTGKRRLTRLGDARTPAWSPNGKKIAFAHSGDIWLLELIDGRVRRLTESGLDESLPDWSPDGRRLAYETVDADADYEVFVMNSDGTGRKNLSQNAYVDGHPVWSADGKWIAFVSDRDQRDSNPSIYVVDADGDGELHKVRTPGLDDYAIDWAADPDRSG